MIFLKIKKISQGFTLLETMMAISIFIVLIFIVSTLLISVIRNPNQELLATEVVDRARIIASNFTNEIRASAYGSYPLVQASDQSIIFYSTIGALGNNVNKIRYYLSGTTLYKGVIVPVNGIYNPSIEVISTVLTGVQNASSGTPLFYYYDGNYNGSGNPFSQPVSIPSVRFIKINLVVQNNIVAKNSGTFLVNAGATIRSLKDNFGN
jgi:type II secretory pathway pseudopilin PulG